MKGAKQRHDGTAEKTKSLRVRISTHKKIVDYARTRKANIVDVVNEAFDHFIYSGFADSLFPKSKEKK